MLDILLLSCLRLVNHARFIKIFLMVLEKAVSKKAETLTGASLQI
jgi:hypothetical protein